MDSPSIEPDVSSEPLLSEPLTLAGRIHRALTACLPWTELSEGAAYRPYVWPESVAGQLGASDLAAYFNPSGGPPAAAVLGMEDAERLRRLLSDKWRELEAEAGRLKGLLRQADEELQALAREIRRIIPAGRLKTGSGPLSADAREILMGQKARLAELRSGRTDLVCRIEAATLEADKVEQALFGLDEAEADFRRLKSILTRRSGEIDRLSRQAKAVRSQPEGEAWKDLSRAESGIHDLASKLEAEAARLDGRIEDAAWLDRAGEYGRSVRTLTEDLDREISKGEADPESARAFLKSAADRLRVLEADRRELARERLALADETTRRLKTMQMLRKETAGIREELKAKAGEALRRIRREESKISGLSRRIERERDRLGRLYACLPPLIGIPRTLEGRISADAIRLAKAEKCLSAAQKHVDAERNRMAGLKPAAPSRQVMEAFQRGSRFLEKLAAVDLSAGTLPRLARQAAMYRDLAAGSVRVERLEEEKARQVRSLVDLERRKIELEETLRDRQAELDALRENRKDLENSLRTSVSRVEGLTRDQDRLSQAREELRRRLDELSGEAERLQAVVREREETCRRLSEERSALEDDHRETLARLDGTARDLEQARAEGERRQADIEGLTEKKGRLEAELSAAREDLTRLQDEQTSLAEEYRGQTEQLSRLESEKAALNGALSDSREEASRLTADNDRLRAVCKEELFQVSKLIQSRSRLIGNQEALIESVNRVQVRLEGLTEENRRLTVDLEAARADAARLGARIGGELEPLVQMLGLALAHSRAETEDLKRDRGALWAGINAMTEISAGLQSRATEMEAENLDLAALTARQNAEIQAQRDTIEQVQPLLAFFLEEMPRWVQAPEPPADPNLQAEAAQMAALVEVLIRENRHLNEELTETASERLTLRLENDHLRRSRAAFEASIEELRPLFAYLWKSWMTTTARLAAALKDRRKTLEALTSLKAQHEAAEAALENVSGRLLETEKTLAAALARVELAEDGREESENARLELEALHTRSVKEIEALRRIKRDLEGEEERRKGEIDRLESEYKRLTAQASALQAENRWLAEKADGWSAERDLLARQLEIQSEQLQLAWIALAGMSEHAQQSVDRLREELDERAESVRNLEERLDDRHARVADLEKEQDRLSLMLWVLIKHSSGLEREMSASGRTIDWNRTLKEKSKLSWPLERLTGRGFQQAARQAARRGLWSVLMAGGVVFGTVSQSSLTSLITSENQPATEIVQLVEYKPVETDVVYSPLVERPVDVAYLPEWDKSQGAEHARAAVEQDIRRVSERTGMGVKVLAKMTGRVHDADQKVSVADLNDVNNFWPAIRNEFPKVHETFRQAKLPPDMVTALYGLATNRTPEECRFWDRLYADYTVLMRDPRKSLSMVLNNIQRHDQDREKRRRMAFEGDLKPIPALESLPLSSFSKVLKPFIAGTLKQHYPNSQLVYSGREAAHEDYARVLAEDMGAAAQTFGVPRTLMVAIVNYESHFANVLGDHNMSASPYQIYRPTKPHIIKQMSLKGLEAPKAPEHLQDYTTLAAYMAAAFISELMDRNAADLGENGLLCNLDRVARRYNGHANYPAAVNQKKILLLNYLDLVKTTARQTAKNQAGQVQGAATETN